MTELSYSQRANSALNPAGKRLLKLMDEKQTNLCVNADVSSCQELLAFADLLGPEICLLKTHVDILEDFSNHFIQELIAIAEKHNFMIFEDRKFADIGTISKAQYQKGIYRISEWADIINCHIVPGPGIIEGLKEVGLLKARGLLLLAQMSSEGSMAKGSYTQQAIRLAEEHAEFVIGFISMEKISSLPGMIHCTPGVNLVSKGDSLKQQFMLPAYVISEKKSDVIIVGRGIVLDPDPLKAAQSYRKEGWNAYINRLS